MSSPASDRAPNRLAAEPSPYLRQHAHNPVDWYPWGEEAFEKARREDLPVFLSIGYSACHWCHVMERESFEDESIAALLNERFVSIKVDREERPDVDDVYMTAVQAIAGHGGWPLSVFLLPDGRPFFGGTYFPPEDRPGRPGFPTMLLRVSETFRKHRRGVEGSAEKLVEEIERHGSLTQRAGRHPLGPPLLEALTEALARSFDARFGGFGGAPKFPPHLALEWLLRRAAAGDGRARSLAVATLDAMALGGIHDHLGGGFHRYSTDARWLLPHFEKMLTDNAQLLAVYSRAFALTGSELYRRVARATGDYLLAGMRGPEGAFHAATDADSEGVEGKYFVWSEDELRAVLGNDDAFFCQAYQVRPEGNYREEATGEGTGLNVLHLAEEPSGEEEKRLAPLREKLKAVRAGRVPPALDDKRVAGWNALAVSGLAIAAGALGEPRYLEAARQAARFLLGPMRDGAGRLLRTWKDGQARIVAFLEDEAFLAHALLDLAAAEPDEASRSAWRREARLVVEGMKRRFLRPEGFAFAGEGNETLLCPMRDLFDKAIPSASGSAVRAMVRLAVVEGDAALALEAWDHLDDVSGLMARAPHGTETWALALDELLASGLVELEAEGDEREPASLPVHPAPRPAPAGEPVTVRAEPPAGPVARGATLEVTVTVSVAEGYALTGAAGLTVEAWGGPDLVKSAVVVPPPATVRHPDGSTEPGYAGEVPVTLVFAVAPAAAAGDHLISVVVKARACGAGSCLPERAFSLSLPVSVGR